MESLVAIALLVLVATITPGPNNYVVLHIGADRGLSAALPAAFGVTFGGLSMLAIAIAGLGGAAADLPLLRLVIGGIGSAWLVWLAVKMISGACERPGAAVLPGGVWALVGFQFTNPKAWTLVLTVAAAIAPAGGELERWQTVLGAFALFVVIPPASLLLWAAIGRLLIGFLDSPRRRRWFDRVSGLLLLAAALVLSWPMLTDAVR